MKLITARNLTVLVATACLLLVALLLLEFDRAAAVAKLVASSAFVALAIKSGGLQTSYGRAIVLGLCFSWCGDALLIGKSQALFLFGLGAFLLAHIAYIVAFVARGVSARWAAVAALPIVTIAIVISVWLGPHFSPELAIPVRVYTMVISMMVIAAFATYGCRASAFILAGALLFFLSDLSVAALRLVQTDFPTYVWGLPFYYAAQVCLAVSTSQSRSH